MKIRFILILFFVVLLENVLAKEQIYFLQATIADDNFQDMKPTEAFLWKFDLEDFSLTKIDSLCPWKYNNDEQIVSVNSFPNEKMLSIRTKYYKDIDELSYSYSIDFNEKPKITQNDYFSLFNIKNKLYWGTIENDGNEYYLKIVNNRKSEKKSLNAYENILIEEITNSRLYIGELLKCKKDGRLSIIQNTDTIPLSVTEMPLNFFHGEEIYCLIKDDYHMVLKYPQKEELLCYDMHNRTWSKINMTYPQCSLLSNNSWILGSYHLFDKDGKVSPGANCRDSIYNCDWYSVEKRYEFEDFPNYRATGFGYTFDQKSKVEKAYYPGTLFLYNSLTNQYIEHNTNQGDSQALLIHNNILYYRINNMIFSAPIIEGNRIGDSKMILKNPFAVDFHWAFFVKDNY